MSVTNGVSNQIQQYLSNHVPVSIHHNNELGNWVYAVVVYETDFWLDAFGGYEQAMAYCEDNKLQVIL